MPSRAPFDGDRTAVSDICVVDALERKAEPGPSSVVSMNEDAFA